MRVICHSDRSSPGTKFFGLATPLPESRKFGGGTSKRHELALQRLEASAAAFQERLMASVIKFGLSKSIFLHQVDVAMHPRLEKRQADEKGVVSFAAVPLCEPRTWSRPPSSTCRAAWQSRDARRQRKRDLHCVTGRK
jgi:hypothetical protein